MDERTRERISVKENEPMKPTLIYDGYCNLCIQTVKMLESQNHTTTAAGGTDFKVALVPFQRAGSLIETYNLNTESLKSALHFISPEGKVFKAGEALEQLAEYFPLLKLGSGFFTTALGASLYKRIAENRYGIFGCAEECYVSEFYESPDVESKEVETTPVEPAPTTNLH
jgi:predicted DCC family thiol-disulfide oxidoreductase YuxK